MADSRILHRAAGDSEKVAALSDLEYRVWTQYLLSADDFGVMPASAFVVQGANRNMRQRPTRAIQKALDAVIWAGLVLTFTHQKERYIWQPDWNDWQGIRYPRSTVWPVPSDLSAATKKTRELFDKHAAAVPSDFGNASEIDPTPVRAGGRETLTQTQTPAQTPTPEGSLRETERQERQRYGPPIVGGPLEHRSHGWCNDRGLCLPASLYRELLARLGPKREGEFRVWLGSVIDALGEDESPGDSVFDFWRNHFAAWRGTVTSKPSTQRETQGNRLQRVGDAFMANERARREQSSPPLPPARPQRQIAGGE